MARLSKFKLKNGKSTGYAVVFHINNEGCINGSNHDRGKRGSKYYDAMGRS